MPHASITATQPIQPTAPIASIEALLCWLLCPANVAAGVVVLYGVVVDEAVVVSGEGLAAWALAFAAS